jgi:hypothetical protein
MTNYSQKEARQHWIWQLRYEGLAQCNGVMTDGVGFCCLGVAEYSQGHQPVQRPGLSRFEINGQMSTMSRDTAFRLGFLEQNPFLWVIPETLEPRIRSYDNDVAASLGYQTYRNEVCLSFLNDKLGLTLSEIADVCDAQPENWTGVQRVTERPE